MLSSVWKEVFMECSPPERKGILPSKLESWICSHIQVERLQANTLIEEKLLSENVVWIFTGSRV